MTKKKDAAIKTENVAAPETAVVETTNKNVESIDSSSNDSFDADLIKPSNKQITLEPLTKENIAGLKLLEIPNWWDNVQLKDSKNYKSSLIIDGEKISPIYTDIDIGDMRYRNKGVLSSFIKHDQSVNNLDYLGLPNSDIKPNTFDVYIYAIKGAEKYNPIRETKLESIVETLHKSSDVIYQILLLDRKSTMVIDTKNNDGYGLQELRASHTNILIAVNADLKNVFFNGLSHVDHYQLDGVYINNSGLNVQLNPHGYHESRTTISQINIYRSNFTNVGLASQKRGVVNDSKLNNVNLKALFININKSTISKTSNYYHDHASLKKLHINKSKVSNITFDSTVSFVISSVSLPDFGNSLILAGPYDYVIDSIYDISNYQVTEELSLISTRVKDGFVISTNKLYNNKHFLYPSKSVAEQSNNSFGFKFNRNYNQYPTPLVDYVDLRQMIIDKLDIKLFKGSIDGNIGGDILSALVDVIKRRISIAETIAKHKLIQISESLPMVRFGGIE